MSCNCFDKKDQAGTFVCTCDEFVHPLPLKIGAGLSDIPRQIAGFPEFRRAMLRSIRSKDPLKQWRAREEDDLGIMLVEMWSYVCDTLSFYDKLIAQETYTGTAILRPSLRKLIALLGYLPAPAVSSLVKLAAIADGRSPLTIPAGTAFRSSAFDGNPPQVFESDEDTLINPLTNSWNISSIRPLTILQNNPSWLLIDARLEIKPFSRLLLLDYAGGTNNQALRVSKTESYIGVDGRNYTKIYFVSPAQLAAGKPLADLWLLLPDSNSILWYYAAALESNNDQASWDRLSGEIDRYTTTNNSGLPTAPPGQIIESIASRFRSSTFLEKYSVGMVRRPEIDPVQTALQYGTPTAGIIINEPGVTLSPRDGLTFDNRPEKPMDGYTPEEFALADKNGRGVSVKGKVDYDNGGLSLRMGETWSPDLLAPVTVFGNLLPASRGETVFNEILGSGDASMASQKFKLSKKPLTYLLSPTADNDRGVKNTLRVYVDGIKWKEVPGFFGIGPSEEVYIVRQDDDGESYTIFGDGIRGKRLPGGSDNVIAYYRYGAGKAAPPADTITQIQDPVTGLGSVSNPMDAVGGDDAEQEESLRTNAPKSALILGRAVSIQDMEAVSLSTPGVRSVQAEWHWHGIKQCPVVYIWYIGEAGIETLLTQRLRSLTDPSTPIAVERALPKTISISIDIVVDPKYIESNVLASLRNILTAPGEGFLEPEQLLIGKPLFRSRIFETVTAVEGVVSVQNILWNHDQFTEYYKKPDAGYYFDFEQGEVILNGNK